MARLRHGFKPVLDSFPSSPGDGTSTLANWPPACGKYEIDERFDEIVEYAELEDAIDRPIKTYSAGMFSRLASSVAMNLDPEILLLNEILAVGDASFQEKSLKKMRELLDRAGTILFVSHSLSSVEEFCDRAIWLDRREIAANREASAVVEEYRKSVKTSEPD